MLAGGGWFGVTYSPSRAQFWVRLGTPSKLGNGGCQRLGNQSVGHHHLPLLAVVEGRSPPRTC
jgi:hypothetical protein